MFYRDIRELHRQAAQDLSVNEEAKDEMEELLSELQQLLVGVSIMQDLTMRAKDSLVSFGERLSTRLFAAFLRAEVRTSRIHQAVVTPECSLCIDSVQGACCLLPCSLHPDVVWRHLPSSSFGCDALCICMVIASAKITCCSCLYASHAQVMQQGHDAGCICCLNSSLQLHTCRQVK